MENSELDRSKARVIAGIIEYRPDTVISQTIINRLTGNVTLSSFDTGQLSAENICPFDIFIQVIDGAAELNIDNVIYNIRLGDGIIIPAHARHIFSARERFKMITTIIKSGYEDL